RTLHPFMPFISEEIWQRLREPLHLEGDSIMLCSYPEPGQPDDVAESEIEWLKEVLQGIRRIRSELNLAPSLKLPLQFQAGTESDRERSARFESLLASLGRVASLEWLGEDADASKAAVALVGDLRVLIPLEGLVDVKAELQRLNKQLASERAGLKQSQGKLSNKRFVDNAPEEVVLQEQQRLATHESRVSRLEEQIERLEKL
ncbi:MAG: class I tRNA ligase family protein, partial [Gammaproteobacteria bacterium]|nr:class I tRNA ligase family protein [Gammaproteobacteria bacterium]